MKNFTIGITTFNEGEGINHLLDNLARIDPQRVDIMVYDDCSTDSTRSIINGHHISRQKNFLAHFSDKNDGTPSVGRTFFGHHAKTEYISLVDGDDLIFHDEYERFVDLVPSNCDIILSSYSLRGKKIGLEGRPRFVDLTEENVTRILSGIGGKTYRRSLLAQYGPDKVRGRSDDVRLHMRIFDATRPRIYAQTDICYYYVEQSRKSTRAASLNFGEFSDRVKSHRRLAGIYPIGSKYIESTEKQIRLIIKKDPSLSEFQRIEMTKKVDDIFRTPIIPVSRKLFASQKNNLIILAAEIESMTEKMMARKISRRRA